MLYRKLFSALTFSAFASVGYTISVSNTVLILARDASSANSASSGLQGYGIPYQVVTVPQAGTTLPTLNADNDNANFGAIVVVSEVSYDYGGGSFRSALSAQQWQQLFDYQTRFGVRMVRLDVYPSADFGVTPLGGTSADQPVSISNSSAFPTSNLKLGATVSITGLYHYPASISNASIAWEIARFSAGGGYPISTAAVINRIGQRQQQVWFIPFATEWSQASNFLQHAWIHWATRGLYSGFRRLYFSTQVDDMFLETDLYQPAGQIFRVRPNDLTVHRSWTPAINAKMSPGSNYFVEIAHNGNGDIEASVALNSGACNPPSAIEYPEQIDTPLEFQKPLGTGTNIWPVTPVNYTWSSACARIDPLEQWWANTANRDAFAHVSHTFSHMGLNNATYADTYKEIQFNQKWLAQVGLSDARRFSASGIVPPAITGLHNGDAIRAWLELGIRNVVGDNTRPVLRNQESTFWPLISTVASNGYAGLNIVPRWATTIYYNCDLPDCTLQEWINTSGGSGDFNNLMRDAVVTNSRNLLGLHWDPFMFHQANMRQTDVPNTVVNGVSSKLSLLQIWVEIVVAEMTRLTSWPMITLKHDDIAAQFLARMARDKCQPKLTWNYSTAGNTIVGATLSTNGNTCSTPVPVTFPGPVASTNGGTAEQVGSDPLTVWATMRGSAITYNLATPIPL